MRAYPEYEVAFVYDEGYESVLAISLRNEKEDLRIKSLFEKAEGLDGIFFLDTVKNRLIDENITHTVFTTNMNGSAFSSAFTLQTEDVSKAKLMAYDNEDAFLHYCSNDALMGMKMDNHDPVRAPNLPCSPLVASKGIVYYTNVTSQNIVSLSYDLNGVQIMNANYAPLPVKNEKIITFKRYAYGELKTGVCETISCTHICVPADETGKPTCACTDYYKTDVLANGTKVCVKDTLHSPGIIYAVSLVSNNTLFYRLEGNPASWIRRPQREQLFTIKSGIVGLAFDWDQQRLLIAETQYRQIATAKMDSTFTTLAHYAGLSIGVKSIAYDWVGGNAIWFDPVFKWLRIVPLTDYHSLLQRSSDISSLVSLSTTSIFKTALVLSELEGYSLTLDAESGFLFFLDLEEDNESIHVWKTWMDGSNPVRIHNVSSTVFIPDVVDLDSGEPLPGSLTCDYLNKELWAGFTHNVFVLDYDGNIKAKFDLDLGKYTIHNSRVDSVQVFQSKYFFLVATEIFPATGSNTTQSTMFVFEISRLDNGTTSGIEMKHNRTFNGDFRALTEYQETPAITPQLNCSNSGCQYMCTNINGKATCMCPDGYLWNTTSKECYTNSTLPSAPVVVYNTQDKICYKSLENVGQPTASFSPLFFDTDSCFQNGNLLVFF